MLLCSIEEAYHKYCYFVTLTYNNADLPRVSLEVLEPRYDLFGNLEDMQRFVFICATPRLSCYNEILHEQDFSMSYMSAYMSKLSTDDKTLPILYYKDVQLYVKRVRKRLSKFSLASVRYYAVGEYGPKTFRAHWHILFYFSDDRQAENFIETACDCWQYGRVDVSASRHSSASYLAGYVNNYSCVPSILQARPFRPRCFHSFRFGFSPYEEDKEEIYKDPFAYIDAKVLNLHSGYVSGRFTNRLRVWLFPRCPCFSDKDAIQAYSYYAFSSRISELLPDVGEREQIKYIVDAFFGDLSRFNTTLLAVVRSVVKSLFDMFSPTPTLISDKDYFVSFITRAIYFSRHFVRVVCDGRSSVEFCISRIRQIKEFYDKLASRSLQNFYRAMQEYSTLYPDDTSFSCFYDDCIGFSDDEPQLSPLVLQLREQYAYKKKERIKHRELNDANNIFIID